MPYLLEGSPSLVVTSDAGHGIGYTGLRIRGTDPTRINVTLNGIPVNDAESHNVFWVDLPDIAGSTTNVQIQRGIGWSQPGAGDLGGGIHLNTLAFHYDPYILAELGAGSFDTKNASLSLGSGLIKGRFTLDGRGSIIQSKGFIDRASSELYSLYGSLGYHHDLTNVRLIYALGDELTYQSWNGVPEQYVFNDSLRSFNTAGIEKSVDDPHDNEVDDYRQTYYQLHVDQAITPFARWTNALHYTRGLGFFEQYKAGQALNEYELGADTSDLIRRRWLDNHFYGFTSTIQIGSPLKRYLVIGGGWNKYLGDHFGEVIWTEDLQISNPHQYYFNEAEKNDWNVFARSNTRITEDFGATVDLQGRWITYQFEGPDQNGNLTDQNVRHRFFNPKVGLTYTLSENSVLYALSGLMNKEPNRDDYVNSTPSSRPSSERLWDNELGFRFSKGSFNAEIVGYYMDYVDQLVPTGRLNDVGAYTRVNVERSHRAGIETSFSTIPVKNFSIEGTMTLSENKIEQFDEYIDNWETNEQEIIAHENAQIAFSPNVLASLKGSYSLFPESEHQFNIHLTGRFVGKQYVDNTSNPFSVLNEYFVTDGGITWKWNTLWAKNMRVSFFVKNLFDHQYESNGWIYRFRSPSYNPVPDDAYAGGEEGSLYHLKGYFPQAGRQYYLKLSLAF
jgi:iron complex outermembrane receptor protein